MSPAATARLCLLAASLLPACAAPAAAEPRRPWADAHLHYVDFFQQTEGMDALFQAMDRAGIERVVLSGMPVTKKWHEDEPKRPRFYQGDDAPLYWYSATDALLAEAVQSLPPARRVRVHPFLSGFNPNDKNATAHIEAMLSTYPDLWHGIGEVFTRHDDLTSMILGEAPRANNEAMHRVYRLAAEHDLPVLLHSNLTSVREREPIYLAELEEALGRHPDTRFLWAHAGTSAEINRSQGRIRDLPGIVGRLLDDHDNLWIDPSWSMLEPYLLDRDGRPQAVWLDLVRRHPDRFLVGSDKVGRFAGIGESLRGFEPLLAALPPEVADAVAGGNLDRLLPTRVRRQSGPAAAAPRPAQ